MATTQDSVNDWAASAETRSKVQQDFLIPSSAVTGAFGNIVEAHNGLAQKLSEAQRELDASREENAKCSDERKQLAAQIKEVGDGQARLEEALRKKLEELREALDALDKRVGDTSTGQQQMRTELEEGFASKIGIAERGVAEIAAKLGGIISSDLPRCQAELDEKMRKLDSELKSQAQDAVARESALKEAAQRDRDEARKACTDMDARLTAELERLCCRLGDAEAAASKDVTAVEGSVADLVAATTEIRKLVGSESSRLEQFAQSAASTALGELRGNEGSRLAKLEGIIKQAEYERLSFQDRVDHDFEHLRGQISAARAFAADRCQASAREQSAETEMLRKDVESRVTKTQLDEVASHTQAVRSEVEIVRAELSKTSQSLAAEDEEIRTRLETQRTELEGKMEQGSAKLREAVRQEEGFKIALLEKDLGQANSDRRAAVGTLSKDIGAVRAEVGACKEHAEGQYQGFSTTWTSRMAGVTQVISEFSQNVQVLDRTVASWEGRFGFLERIVQDIEARRWPWRAGLAVQHARQRSSSPPGAARSCSMHNPSDGRSGGASSSADGAAMEVTQAPLRRPSNFVYLDADYQAAQPRTQACPRQVPVPPAGFSRPGSSRWRREEQDHGTSQLSGTVAAAAHSQQQHASSKPVGVLLESAPLAGSAYSAARATRGPQPPSQ